MSWFDKDSLSSFAKTAFSSAQKSIDRVLDIQDEEGRDESNTGIHTHSPTTADGTAGTPTAAVPTSQQRIGSTSSPQLRSKENDTTTSSKKEIQGTVETPSSKTPTSATPKFQDDGDHFWNSFFDSSPTPVLEKTNLPKKTRPTGRRPQIKQKSLGTAKLPGLQRDLKNDLENADEESPIVADKSRHRRPLRLKTGGKTSTRDTALKTKEDSVVLEKTFKDAEKKDDFSVESGAGKNQTENTDVKHQPLEIVGEEEKCNQDCIEKNVETIVQSDQAVSDTTVKQSLQPPSQTSSTEEPDKELENLSEKKEGNNEIDLSQDDMTISQEPEMLEIPDEKEESVPATHPDSPIGPKSDNSLETNVDDHDRTSCRSDSDFVVINETGSEQSSVYMYDNRASPEIQSPKHYSSSSNGKRSPDSDFSIISEGRFHDMQDSLHSDIRVNTDCPQESPLSPPQRASPSYSADVESEDQDDKSTAPSSREGVEEDMVREGASTPTPDSDLSPTEGPCEDIDRSTTVSNSPRSLEKDGDESVTSNVQASEVSLADSSSTLDSTPTGDTGANNPLQAEKLLKKLAEMAEVLQAREAQILSLSKQNMDLTETTNILRNQLQQSESSRESEMQDLSALTEEFTQRISMMEKKLQAAMKERNTATKDIQQLKKDLANKETSDQAQKLIQEKDEQIAELLAEGEKLSKQQLQNSNIIKKLRVREKDNESVLKTQRTDLDEALERVKHLEKVLDAKEEIEKQQKDSIKKLNTAVEKQDKELLYTRSEMEDAKEKARSVQNALDGSYKEIAELHKKLAAKESKAQEATLSVEMNAKEELRLALERSQQEARRDHEGLLLQVNDLQMALGRAEQQYARKEDSLRQEIIDLQTRLQEGESRNQELTQSVTAATRPLLRQIENLQSNFNAQSSSWEHVERSLTERLADSQTQLASATEKERMVTESALEAGSKLASLESQLALIKQEKSRLSSALEMEKAKVESLEESKQREMAHGDSQRHTYLKALEESQREKLHLEKQLESEKMKVDTERKKLILAQETLTDRERRLQLQQQQLEDSSSSHSPHSRSSTPTQHSNHSHPGTPLIMPSQGDILERTMSWSATGPSVYESVAVGSASSVLENLQAQLKQREGELVQRQGEIFQLERTRASMAEEIVHLANKCESFEELVKEIPELRKVAKEIEHRYNAVLQMYGEKAEEVQELKLDLQDVKEMYRQQIEDLIRSS